jgi:hypothetical protein
LALRQENAALKRRLRPRRVGHVGVYRASDGKGWKAYVMGEDDVMLLGIYPNDPRGRRRPSQILEGSRRKASPQPQCHGYENFRLIMRGPYCSRGR